MIPDERAVTPLECIVIVALFAVTCLAMIHFLSAPAALPGGLIPAALKESGDSLMPVGSVVGYAATDGKVGAVPLRYGREDSSSMGAVSVVVSLFIGDMGGIDMDRATVAFANRSETCALKRSDETPLGQGEWAISGKYNMVPFREADSDSILEPGEQFELLFCPAVSLSPREVFIISVAPQGGMPLSMRRTVPPRITQVMDLG